MALVTKLCNGIIWNNLTKLIELWWFLSYCIMVYSIGKVSVNWRQMTSSDVKMTKIDVWKFTSLTSKASIWRQISWRVRIDIIWRLCYLLTFFDEFHPLKNSKKNYDILTNFVVFRILRFSMMRIPNLTVSDSSGLLFPEKPRKNLIYREFSGGIIFFSFR